MKYLNFSTGTIIFFLALISFVKSPVLTQAQSYCSPVNVDCSEAGIEDFSIEEINNENSGCPSFGYGDYTSDQNLTTELEPGASYRVDVHLDGTKDQHFALWLDYNQSNVFDGSNLLWQTGQYYDENTPFYFNLTIPSEAEHGYTRLRVASSYLNTPDKCGNWSLNPEGEIQDYEVYILPEKDVGVNHINTPSTVECLEGSETREIKIEIENFGTEPQSGFDIITELTGDLDTVITTTYSSSLYPGSTDEVIIADLPANGGDNWNINAYTDLEGDKRAENDDAIRSVQFTEIPDKPEITGPDEACKNEEGVAYSVDPGADHYNWYVQNGSITSGDGTPDITVDWSNDEYGELVAVKSNDGCSSRDTLDVNLTEANVEIDGPTDICADDFVQTYSIQQGLDDYFWYVTGGTIQSGQGTNELTVEWENSSDNYLSVEVEDDNCYGFDDLTVNIDYKNVWELNSTLNNMPVTSIEFLDNENGMVLTMEGEIFTTDNGAESWDMTDLVEQSDAYNKYYSDLVFNNTAGGTRAYALGEYSYTSGTMPIDRQYLYRSIDKGESWTSVELNFMPLSVDMAFDEDENTNAHWIVGANGNLRYSNFTSAHYSYHNSGTSEHLYSVYANDIYHAWAVGANGTIIHTSDGDEWSEQESGVSKLLLDVHFVNENKGWIVGEDGLILHTNDGGENWDQLPNETVYSLISVQFVDENTGWITGQGGTILYTSDGGENWNSLNLPPEEGVNSLYAIDESKQYIGTSDGNLYNNKEHNISGPKTACERSEEINEYSFDYDEFTDFSWEASNGTITGGQESKTVSVKWDGKDSGEIKLIADDGSCSIESSLQVELKKAPEPEIEGPEEVCYTETEHTYSTQSVSNNTYSWEADGGTITSSDNNEVTIEWEEEGTGNVLLTQYNHAEVQACDTTVNMEVNVLDVIPPVSEFSYERDDLNVQFTPEVESHTEYLWDFGDGTTNQEVTPSHQYDETGTYTVSLEVTEENGCKNQFEKEIELDQTNFLQNRIDELYLDIYPNPVADHINVSFYLPKSSNGSITLFNIEGQRVYDFKENISLSGGLNEYEMDVPDLPKGVYILKIHGPDYNARKKVVIEP